MASSPQTLSQQQSIKDILNTIGNPSYMLSYRKDGNGKYQVANVTIRKRGSASPDLVGGKRRELQEGEMEVGILDGKYSIRANADAYLGLSETYERVGRIDKSLESMDRYVSLTQDEKKVKEIKKKIDYLRQKDMGNYYVFIKNGDEFRGKGDKGKAIDEYEKAINLKQELVLAYKKMGKVYEENKDYQKAEEMYQKAIDKDASDYDLYVFLGLVKAKSGKNKEALELMEIAHG